MSDVVRIVISGKPQPNQRARSRRYREGEDAFTSHYTPTKTRNERLVWRQRASEAMEGREPFAGAVDFRATFYRSVPTSWPKAKRAAALRGEIRPTTKPDWDNYEKMVDALKGICWVDDAQVTDAHTFKRYAEVPRVVIEVRDAG